MEPAGEAGSRRVGTGAAVTYSIVARDPASGELGVAVQTGWLAVGSLCPWARAGVGGPPSPSSSRPSGRLLERLAPGRRWTRPWLRLVTADEGRDVRQAAGFAAAGLLAEPPGVDLDDLLAPTARS